MRPRMVVFECHHLGDSVMALPFLRGAGHLFDVEVVCTPAVAEMLGGMLPEVRTRGVAGWRQALRAARSLHLTSEDATACVWADARMDLLAKLSGAGRRAGFPMTPTNYYASRLGWRKRRMVVGTLLSWLGEAILGSPLLNLPLDRHHEDQPHLACWQQLASALGFAMVEHLPWFPAPQPGAVIDQFVHRARQAGRKVLVVHPGARLPTKRWPADRFAALLQRLDDAGGTSVIVIAPPGEACPATSGEHQMAYPSRDWREMASALAVSDVVLANDSFASHTAAALGKKVLTIFGSGNPSWFAPYGNFDGVLASEVCPHRPCIDRCVMPSPVCIESVEIDFVEYRLREVLEGT